MDLRRYSILCVLTVLAAFAGGYIANRPIAVARAQDVIPNNMRANGFIVTNAQGQPLATLLGGPSGAELRINDARGRLRVELSPSAGLVIRDAFGDVWRRA